MEQDPIKLQGELLTQSVVEEGLFRAFENFKTDQYTLIIYQENIQATLGLLSYKIYAREVERHNSFFSISVNSISTLGLSVEEFIEQFKNNYSKHYDTLTVVGLDVVSEQVDVSIVTEDRVPIKKSIAESVFEKLIMDNVEETIAVMDYKFISDLSLTLLDPKEKLSEPNNAVDVSLLIEKFKETLQITMIDIYFNREKIMNFIKSELEKFMIVLGVPY